MRLLIYFYNHYGINDTNIFLNHITVYKRDILLT